MKTVAHMQIKSKKIKAIHVEMSELIKKGTFHAVPPTEPSDRANMITARDFGKYRCNEDKRHV